MSIKVKNINFLIDSGNLFQKDITFELKDNQNILLYGPSGSGKTSIFKMLSFFMPPSRGEIYYDDNHISSFNKANKIRSNYISLIDSSFSFFNNLNIEDNIKVYGIFAKVPHNIINKRMEYLYETFKFNNENISLNNLKNKKISDLSNGQKEIIMIARALILQSKFIFADELLRSFNVHDKEDIFDKFMQSLKEFNMGLFMISHEDRFKKHNSIDRIWTIKEKMLKEEV